MSQLVDDPRDRLDADTRELARAVNEAVGTTARSSVLSPYVKLPWRDDRMRVYWWRHPVDGHVPVVICPRCRLLWYLPDAPPATVNDFAYAHVTAHRRAGRRTGARLKRWWPPWRG